MYGLPPISIVGMEGRVSSHATWEPVGISDTPDSTTVPVLGLREKAIGSNMPPVAIGVWVSGEISNRCLGIMVQRYGTQSRYANFLA
jgi:hypothetical protein